MIDFPTRAERRVEAQRLLDGLSPQWVADRFGKGKATIRLWKNGQRTPNLEDLLRLAVATGRPLDGELQARIFGGEPERVGVSLDEEQAAVETAVAGRGARADTGTEPDPVADDRAGAGRPGEAR